MEQEILNSLDSLNLSVDDIKQYLNKPKDVDVSSIDYRSSEITSFKDYIHDIKDTMVSLSSNINGYLEMIDMDDNIDYTTHLDDILSSIQNLKLESVQLDDIQVKIDDYFANIKIDDNILQHIETLKSELGSLKLNITYPEINDFNIKANIDIEYPEIEDINIKTNVEIPNILDEINNIQDNIPIINIKSNIETILNEIETIKDLSITANIDIPDIITDIQYNIESLDTNIIFNTNLDEIVSKLNTLNDINVNVNVNDVDLPVYDTQMYIHPIIDEFELPQDYTFTITPIIDSTNLEDIKINIPDIKIQDIEVNIKPIDLEQTLNNEFIFEQTDTTEYLLENNRLLTLLIDKIDKINNIYNEQLTQEIVNNESNTIMTIDNTESIIAPDDNTKILSNILIAINNLSNNMVKNSMITKLNI